MRERSRDVQGTEVEKEFEKVVEAASESPEQPETGKQQVQGFGDTKET